MPRRQPEFNLKKLDGVFGYSVFSGFMLSILIFTEMDVSETGTLLTVLQTVADTLGSPSPYLVPAVSIIVTIIGLVVIGFNIIQISEHGYSGAIVSGTGFFGTLLVFYGAMGNIQVATYIGVAMWFVGVIASRIGE